MVNHGASSGCLTCKQRRVKCDEARPSCGRCMTRGVTCGGYGRKPLNIRFKTQSISTGDGDTSSVDDSSGVDTTLTAQPGHSKENMATHFFINQFAVTGRSLSTSRGFFESIVPIMTTAVSSSTISVATTAVSAQLLHRWTRSSDVLELSRVRLGQALHKLQMDLKEPTKRSDDATLLSILMLQCYENTESTLEWEMPTTVHRDGALVLIKSLGLASFQSEYAKRLILYLLNADINSALCEARSVDLDLRKWAEDADQVPFNMSSQLDLIAIDLAEVQAQFSRVDSNQGEVRHSLRDQLSEVLDALGKWADTVPELWHPFRFEISEQPQPPVEMYLDTCEVYATIEAASIWNTWRNYSLIAIGLRTQLEGGLRDDRSAETPVSDEELTLDDVQALVDAICFSLPFYLGNRSQPSAAENLSSCPVVFPSYRNLHLFGVEPVAMRAPTDMMTADAMQNNAKTQGAWQLTAVLRLLVFTLSKPSSHALRSSLRPGQLQWIEQQVDRVSKLFGISQAQNTPKWTE